MFLTSSQELTMVKGGVEIFSTTGILILITGTVFTIGIPLVMILKGRKD